MKRIRFEVHRDHLFSRHLHFSRILPLVPSGFDRQPCPRLRSPRLVALPPHDSPTAGLSNSQEERYEKHQDGSGWASLATFFSAAVMAAGMLFVTAPAHAALELPEGEKITNVPVVPRAIPQKEEYELYDPQIGKNFDLKKFLDTRRSSRAAGHAERRLLWQHHPQ